MFNRSQKSGKKLTTYAVHTNDTHFKKNKHTTMKNSSDNLWIFHKNIRGLHRKTDELTTHWENFFPHILCITEHHLRDYEIGNISISRYNLGAFYCRKGRKQGGVKYFCTGYPNLHQHGSK